MAVWTVIIAFAASIVNNVLIAKICMLHQIVLIVPIVVTANTVMGCMM